MRRIWLRQRWARRGENRMRALTSAGARPSETIRLSAALGFIMTQGASAHGARISSMLYALLLCMRERRSQSQ